jgi:hypothetical protein
MPTFDRISASRAVLIEVMNALGSFREDIVLVVLLGVSEPVVSATCDQ